MRLTWVVTAVSLSVGLALGAGGVKGQDQDKDQGQAQELKLADCPAAVRKALQAEAKGAAIEGVTRERDDEGDTVYWADVTVGGRPYAVGVLEDGTLAEMNLAVLDDEIPLDRCPAAVQATFRREAFGARVESVARDVRYGVPIYEAVVAHEGRSYEVVVAEGGALVEKVLVIDEEEVALADCPAAVQAALRKHADGGTVGEVTRSTGLGRPTYEAEVETRGRVYLVEVAEDGALIAKSLEAVGE